MNLAFLHEQWSVQYGGERITLLPKEYALLHYLYLHTGELRSREQLLNAVWPMEFPTDRTVDDHIYRLRKKLKIWAHLCSIETIRGQGYRFVCNTNSSANPLAQDEELNTSYTALLDKYHLYGQGEAMQILAAHQSILGFRFAEEKQLFLEAVKGNFSAFLRLVEGNHAQTAEQVQYVELLLTSFPYLREHGLFLVLKGLWLSSQQKLSEADTTIEAGMLTLRNSRFVPHVIYGARLLRYFVPFLLKNTSQFIQRYNNHWDELASMYNFPELEKHSRYQLDTSL